MIIASLLWVAPSVTGQTLIVYPGDVTNNGVVNNVDFMYLGFAYNYFGPARDSANGTGVSFLPQQASPWAFSLPNGANFAYADCNGDGLVNYYYDAFPMYVNYGMQRAGAIQPDVFTPGVVGVDPSLRFDASAIPANLHPGQPFQLPLLFGSDSLPVEDLFGLAFSIVVDPQAMNVNDVNVNLSETSWANPDNDRIYLDRIVPGSGNRIDVGWVRTDHNMRSGAGRIGYADFIIVIDVVGLQQCQIRIDSVKMIDKFGNEHTIAGDTLVVNFSPEALSSDENEPDDYGFRLSPNPARDFVNLHCRHDITEVLLADPLGRLVYRATPNQHDVKLLLPDLMPGIYWLEARTENGRIIRPLTIGN